ncbi:MAG: hypothetical protein NDI81_06425 [Desulfobacula sp.]|nr:hypothetical protein [Desulfobacula sp.]
MKKKKICITYLVLFMLITPIMGCGSHQESKKVTQETTTTTETPVSEERQTTTTTTVETK